MMFIDHEAYDAPYSAEAEAEVLPIAAPPCGGCAHWQPKRNWLHGTIPGAEGKVWYEGVRLCHAPDMFYDFSCFAPKEVSG